MTPDLTTPWPADVTARYLTAGYATVDVGQAQEEVRVQQTFIADVSKKIRFAVCPATCSGCGEAKKVEIIKADYAAFGNRDDERALQGAKDWAQQHARDCRAMPRPQEKPTDRYLYDHDED